MFLYQYINKSSLILGLNIVKNVKINIHVISNGLNTCFVNFKGLPNFSLIEIVMVITILQ